MFPISRWIRVALLLAVCLGTIPGMGSAVFAQVGDCLDYGSRDHWLPNPHGTSSTPLKVSRWNDMLVVLRPEGLELTGLDDPQVPAAAGKIAGTFSDFALGVDYIVLSSAGRLQGFNLPELTPRFSYQDASAASPRLACRDTLVVAAFDKQLKLFSNAVPAALAPLGAYEVPQYNSVIGLGSLEISGDYVLGCAGGGDNVAGYYGALTVIDIADPHLPVMTDRVAFTPGNPDSSETLFFEAQPCGPGFVVAGLWLTYRWRPEYNDENEQFLARLTIEDGRIVWHGLVSVPGPMTCGFTLAGETALWTVGLASAGESGSNYVVDLRWILPNPVLADADHHFRPGRMCWIPERGTLVSGAHLYHLEALRTISRGGAYEVPTAEDRHVHLVNDRLAVTWRDWTLQVDHWLWDHMFEIFTHDGEGSPMTVVDGYSTPPDPYDSFTVGGCAIMGSHVYFDISGVAYRLDIDAAGMLSDPIITANDLIRSAIPWDDHFVMATADSLEVCTVDASGEIRTVAALRHASSDGVEMVRVNDLLLVKDHPGNMPPATVSTFDLSELTEPRLVSASTGWNAYLAYAPEAALLFDFGPGALRWQTIDAGGGRTQVGSWSTPFVGAIYDLRLHGDVLYLALAGCGLGVFKFDPAWGLTPLGGDLGVQIYDGIHPARLVPFANGEMLLSPGMLRIGLDCSDPLPVYVSSFHAERDPRGVRLTWRCETTEPQTGQFEVWREDGEREQFVGYQPATRGDHALRDEENGFQEAHSYSLYLKTAAGSRTLLDSAEIAADSPPRALPAPTARPNPFNAATTITFDQPREGPVRISVHDLAGRLLDTLVDANLPAGRHGVAWNGRDSLGRTMGSGVYMARVELSGRVWNVTMGLIK